MILRAITLLIVLVALVALAACGGGSDNEDGAGEPSPTGTVSAEAGVAAAESFDPGDESSIEKLNAIAAAGGDFASGLAPLFQDENADPNSRWAALYLISIGATTEADIALLEPVLEDDDEIFRTMAAGSLAGLGVTDSLPVLIEALSSEADLPFSDPPRPLSSYARATLEHYTGETFDDPDGWQDWWDEVSPDIRWDGDSYVAS